MPGSGVSTLRWRHWFRLSSVRLPFEHYQHVRCVHWQCHLEEAHLLHSPTVPCLHPPEYHLFLVICALSLLLGPSGAVTFFRSSFRDFGDPLARCCWRYASNSGPTSRYIESDTKPSSRFCAKIDYVNWEAW